MNTMTNSRQLLSEYAQNGSETAFRELVSAYLDLVYSTAVRLVDGDTHRAEDVAQIVFVDLARRAHSLPKNIMLGGWLHRHTCFVAANTMRSERRRQSRERLAIEMSALQDYPEANAALIAPLLDEAINELGELDRTAILLRFFEKRDFQSVGDVLGSNEDAARMRVTRALEKLRSVLEHRCVTTSAGTLGVVLAAKAVYTAPFGLVASISTSAIVSKTVAASAAIKTVAMTTFQKTMIGSVIAFAIGVGIYEAHQASSLRAQVQALQHERNSVLHQLASVLATPAPRLPAPQIQFITPTSAAPVAEGPTLTNLYSRFQNGVGNLASEQVEAYLKANRTNASTLLAAYRTSRNSVLLREAMEKYPKDPQVAFEAIFDTDLSSDERQQWLNIFKQVAPDNALPFYVAAQNDFTAGQTDKALEEFAAAGSKPFIDYTAERMQGNEEAYLAAGYSPAEAKTIASQDLLLQQLGPMKQLGQSLVSLANAYAQSGDTTSAQSVLQMAMNLGQNVGGAAVNPVLISQLVGAAVQTMALTNMNPGSPYGGNGQTVQDQLNQITQNRAAIKELVNEAQSLLPTLSDQDMMTYESRRALFGEVAAIQWVVSKYGQQ